VDAKLYSFVIVDDEREIREGIRDNIPWEELGFSFAGAYGNGAEALEALEKEMPDVVMTDINMPFMDGLALGERVLLSSPSTKLLILTGYDDFEYARQALRIKASDFILKPVTPRELRATLAALKRTLDEEDVEKRDLEQLKRQLEESRPLLRERFLNRLLVAEAPPADLEGRLASLGIPIPADSGAFQVIAVESEARRAGEDLELDLIAARNSVVSALGQDWPGLAFQDPEDRIVVVSWGQSAEELYRENLKAAETLAARLSRSEGAPARVGVGEAVGELGALGRSYREAMRSLAWLRIRGGKRVGAYRELTGKISDAHATRANWGKAISAALRTASVDSALNLVGEMAETLRSSFTSVEAYYLSLRMTLAALIDLMDDLEIPDAEIFDPGSDPFAEIGKLTDSAGTRAWFAGLVQRIARYLGARQENFAESKAREAAAYIEERYADADLSLASLCKDLYISTSYFSHIFKKHADRTFVEYLTELRVRKAQELLRTSSMKTYEVAGEVGYRDAHYFSLIFRKATGTTPSAYRNGGTDAGD